MKSVTNKKPEADIEQLGNVDQIRDILFGAHLKEMTERFEKNEERIKALQSEMRKKSEQNQLDFENRISSEINATNNKIKNIISSQQDELSDVRDSALKLEKRLQVSLDTQEENSVMKHDQLHKQQIEIRNALRSQMDTLQDELFEVMEGNLTEMGRTKLSRADAANILMEAAIQMKGGGINQQLNIETSKTKTSEKEKS